MTNLGQRETPQPSGGLRPTNRHPESFASTRRSGVKRRAIVAALALTVALLAVTAVACGGGGDEGDASPTPGVSGGSPEPTSTVDASLPTPCQALQSLKTYRYVSDMLLESPESTISLNPGEPTPTSTITREFTGYFLFEYNTDASFQRPDRTEAYITGSTDPMTIITIGDQTWSQINQTWRPSAAIDFPYAPPIICRAVLAAVDLTTVQPQKEKLNDVDALHYTFTQAPLQAAIAEIFREGSDMAVLHRIVDVDVWLVEDGGWPTRIEIQSSGLYSDGRELRMHLVVDIKDANDNSIRVDPPL